MAQPIRQKTPTGARAVKGGHSTSSMRDATPFAPIGEVHIIGHIRRRSRRWSMIQYPLASISRTCRRLTDVGYRGAVSRASVCGCGRPATPRPLSTIEDRNAVASVTPDSIVSAGVDSSRARSLHHRERRHRDIRGRDQVLHGVEVFEAMRDRPPDAARRPTVDPRLKLFHEHRVGLDPRLRSPRRSPGRSLPGKNPLNEPVATTWPAFRPGPWRSWFAITTTGRNGSTKACPPTVSTIVLLSALIRTLRRQNRCRASP